jgi:hypothetical protein
MNLICIFPSLVDDTHIMGFLNEITRAFDHLSTQITIVGLRVKMSKCKLWNPLEIYLGIKIPQGCTLVANGLHILGVPMGSQDFAMYFLDEVLYQNVAYIDNRPLLGNACHNVSLGLATKARVGKGCRPRGSMRKCENEHSHSQVSSPCGSWSPGGLSNLQRVIARIKTHFLEKFFISMERY